jgi:hypothetical protein
MVAWFSIEREAKSNKPTAEGGNMLDFPFAALEGRSSPDPA